MKVLTVSLTCLLFSVCLATSNKTLNFNNGTFKILQLTDMHFGESNLKDLLTMSLQTFLIKKVNPDFVALTGDEVSGYAWDNTTTFY